MGLRDTEVCSVEGCSRAYHVRGWCVMHYRRWQRHGDPLKTLHVHTRGEAKERILSRIRVLENGCWEYQSKFTSRSGHRTMYFEGTSGWLVHRVMWTIENGPIPEGQVVRHRCGTPACVRVDHLRLGTPDDNNADQVVWNRAARRLIEAHFEEFSVLLTEEEAVRGT